MLLLRSYKSAFKGLQGPTPKCLAATTRTLRGPHYWQVITYPLQGPPPQQQYMHIPFGGEPPNNGPTRANHTADFNAIYTHLSRPVTISVTSCTAAPCFSRSCRKVRAAFEPSWSTINTHMGHGLGAGPFVFFATSFYFTTSVVSMTATLKQCNCSSPAVPVTAIRSSAGGLVSTGGTLGGRFPCRCFPCRRFPCRPLITHTRHHSSVAFSALAFVSSISCSTFSRRSLPFVSSPFFFSQPFRTRSRLGHAPA